MPPRTPLRVVTCYRADECVGYEALHVEVTLEHHRIGVINMKVGFPILSTSWS